MKTLLSATAPRVFVNSLPKSGTHLLAKAAETFGYQDYFTSDFQLPPEVKHFPRFLNHRQALKASSNTPTTMDDQNIGIGSLHLCPVDSMDLKRWLTLVPKNNYIQGHIPANTHFNQLLESLNYRHLIIIRDPRAVIASLVPFVNNAKNTLFKAHFLDDDFRKMSLEERFDFILMGGYAEQAKLPIKNFKAVYASFYQWREHSNALLLKFEDLIGEQGGGEQEAQYKAVIKIAQHLGVELTDVESHANQLFDPSVRTFRIGKIDSWKETLSSKLVDKLTAYCEPLCHQMGYTL